MDIKILGSGCPNCKKLEQMTREVADSLGLKAVFEKVTDYNQIMEYPILSTPGLVVNGEVVSSGRIPSKSEIETWLKAAV